MLKVRRYGAARDLFAGALQTFQLGSAAARGGEESQATRMLAAATAIGQAEHQLALAAASSIEWAPAMDSEAGLRREEPSLPLLVDVPFKLQLPTAGEDDTETSLHYFDLSIAKVLFNVGLCHQLMQRHDAEVPSHYHMSSASLANVPDSSETLFLALAVMNNFAIWCNNNENGTGLESCIDQMVHLLDEESDYPTEDWDGPSLNAIRSNIRLLRGNSSGILDDSHTKNPEQEDNCDENAHP